MVARKYAVNEACGEYAVYEACGKYAGNEACVKNEACGEYDVNEACLLTLQLSGCQGRRVRLVTVL